MPITILSTWNGLLMLFHWAYLENLMIGIVINTNVLKIHLVNLLLLLRRILMGNQGFYMDNSIKYRSRVLTVKNMIKTRLGQLSKNKILKTFFSIVFTGIHRISLSGLTKNQLWQNQSLKTNASESTRPMSAWLKSSNE